MLKFDKYNIETLLTSINQVQPPSVYPHKRGLITISILLTFIQIISLNEIKLNLKLH